MRTGTLLARTVDDERVARLAQGSDILEKITGWEDDVCQPPCTG